MQTQQTHRTVYVLGNPIVTQDAMAVKVLPLLRQNAPDFTFIHIDPTDEIPTKNHLILIDTVIGLRRVRIFHSMDDFARSPRTSVHDFDLPVALGLLQKLGKVQEVTIIGVPHTGDEGEIATDVVSLLQSIST